MSRIPDAWDDDYEAFADAKSPSQRGQQPPPAPTPAHAPPPQISRAQRREQHIEANRALWNSAENPEPFHFVEATSSSVPLKTQAKPQLKVLSRKPKKPDTGLENGINGLSIQGSSQQDDDPDSEEEARREQMRTLKERQEKARLEREEKQRRYNERREQLFGTPDASTGAQSPGQRNSGRGRRIGNGRGQRGQGSQTPSSNDQSPTRAAVQQPQRQLYDPGYSMKPDSVYLQKREAASGPRESPIIRNPRGPDGSGRGGFGFAGRGRGRGS